MIFELAYYVQSFLCEHNKPPPKSFHEEMLERRAQEEQRRQLEAKRKEEEEVRPMSPRWPARVKVFPFIQQNISACQLWRAVPTGDTSLLCRWHWLPVSLWGELLFCRLHTGVSFPPTALP